ncbi:DNA-binding protein [Mycobacterium intracellulare]|uniref:helix-turn-helix transcriptional regulator n=1 Tax=Mycobacterium intracellulare TaxID=1767 RepID=UPI000BB050F6|nr:DNA-binding protein [Mycobacterium intracellulare]PBA33442.1 DNA-binding protein [Mycobacterium intracellulare]
MTTHNSGAQDIATGAAESLATAVDVAAHLRTTVTALSQMRYRREGPPYVKFGRRVLYRWPDVHAWAAAHVQIVE